MKNFTTYVFAILSVTTFSNFAMAQSHEIAPKCYLVNSGTKAIQHCNPHTGN